MVEDDQRGGEVAIRRAEPADAPRLRDLNEVALRQVDAFAEDAVEEGMDEDLEDVEANYVEAGGDFFVAESVVDDADANANSAAGPKIVGMGALEPVGEGTFQADRIVHEEDGPAAEITRMRVDPDVQRRGIGTRLVERLEERARELEYEVLVLDTTARQEGAQRLYESFGYEQRDAVAWREYEVLLYRKRLGDT